MNFGKNISNCWNTYSCFGMRLVFPIAIVAFTTGLG